MAGKTARIVTDFSAGVVSRKFDGRLDIPHYYKACRTLENFIVLPTGGLVRRPGTHYVGETKNATTESKLSAFVTDSNNAFMCDFGNGYLRFWKNHAQYSFNNSIVELSSSYNNTDLGNLHFVQRLDANNAPSKYVVSGKHSVEKLTFSNNNFTMANHSSWLTDPNSWFTDYMSTVAIAGGRMWYGRRQSIFASRSMDYHNFNNATGANNSITDADAFTFDIDSELSEEFRWITAKNDIIIGTFQGEWRLAMNSTPTQPYVKKQTSFGSSRVQAMIIGGNVLFVRRDGRRVMEYYYMDEAASYESKDLTFYADHIAGDGIKDWALMQSPFPVVWCVTEGGTLIGLTYEPKAQVVAWHEHPMSGTVDSVAVLPTDNGADEVWLVVKRTIDGTDKRFVEYFTMADTDKDSQRDYFNVDCGYTYDCGAGENITEILKNNNATITFSNNTAFNNNETIKINGVSNFNNVNGQVFMLKNKNNATFDLYDSNGANQIDTSSYGANNANDGAAEQVTKTVTGLTHLNNYNATVIADGGAHPNRTVSNNSITADTYYNTFHVGIPYNSVAETMRMDSQEMLLKTRRINRIRLRLYETLGGYVGPDSTNMDEIYFRNGTDTLGTAPSLFTGDKEKTFPGSYSKEGYVRIEQRQALPMTILAMAVDMTVGDN